MVELKPLENFNFIIALNRKRTCTIFNPNFGLHFQLGLSLLDCMNNYIFKHDDGYGLVFQRGPYFVNVRSQFFNIGHIFSTWLMFFQCWKTRFHIEKTRSHIEKTRNGTKSVPFKHFKIYVPHKQLYWHNNNIQEQIVNMKKTSKGNFV